MGIENGFESGDRRFYWSQVLQLDISKLESRKDYRSWLCTI